MVGIPNTPVEPKRWSTASALRGSMARNWIHEHPGQQKVKPWHPGLHITTVCQWIFSPNMPQYWDGNSEALTHPPIAFHEPCGPCGCVWKWGTGYYRLVVISLGWINPWWQLQMAMKCNLFIKILYWQWQWSPLDSIGILINVTISNLSQLSTDLTLGCPSKIPITL